MLVSELRIELMREHSETQDDPDKISLFITWIKNALEDFALMADFRQYNITTQIPTVIGQAVYELPVSMREVRTISRLDTNQPLTYTPEEVLINNGMPLTQTGLPRYWYFYDSVTVPASNATALRIRVWPTPTAVLNLDVAGIISPSALTDSSIIPAQNEDIAIIKEKVRYFMYVDDKQFEAADRADQRYVEKINLRARRERRRFANQRVLRITDIPARTNSLARLDPNHFRN